MILNFRSDNCSPVLPEIFAALCHDALTELPANGGEAYSETFDDEVARRFGETFGAKVGVLTTLSGTGTNALAIATLLHDPTAPIFCHEEAHVHVWEENAALYLSRAPRFSLIEGADGRISPSSFEKRINSADRPVEGGVLALTTPTEAGTVYPLADLRRLCELSHAAGMSVYVDGARLGSALAALGLSPAEFVTSTGVDAFSFGGTKAGCVAAEAGIFVSPDDSLMSRATKLYRASGQRTARRRFVNVQLLRLLKDGLWIDIARRQNDRCAEFVKFADSAAQSHFVHPCETNQAFLRYSVRLAGALEAADIRFTRWTDGSIRLVFCYHHTSAEIETLARVVRANI